MRGVMPCPPPPPPRTGRVNWLAMLQFITVLKYRHRQSREWLPIMAVNGSKSLVQHLNPVHNRAVVGRHTAEADRQLTAAVGIDREGLDECFVLGSSGGEDVEVREHLRSVDGDAESSRANPRH